MITCPECGIANTADSNYCRRCGTRIETAAPPEETTEGYALPKDGRPHVTLPGSSVGPVLQIRTQGDRDGDLVALSGDVFTIGRNPQSDLFLDDVTVSRTHARVILDTEGFIVEDEGSLNGTYVNRRRIERHQLFDGDELQIGKFKLAFLQQGREGY